MTRLRSTCFAVSACVLLLLAASPVAAQGPPPRIGPFVVDLHGTIPRFPSDPALAESRGLLLAELPGAGFGVQAGAQVYVLSWKAVTFGIGADFLRARAHQGAPQISETETGRAVTETFTHFAPQVSFNFGDGDGWSYFSGGIGTSKWSIVPDGAQPTEADTSALTTINYGGGARWFIKRHLAFSLDVRFYAIDPSPPAGDRPGGPRTTLLIAGAGISLK